MATPILVTTTFEEKGEALSLSQSLLKKRLIACSQVFGPVDSQYWWNGKIELTTEYRLEMKSTRSLWERLETEIKHNHPYENPEIIATAITGMTKEYQIWLFKELQQ